MTRDEIDPRVEHILPTLPGWCTPSKGKRLAHLVAESRARICVELGVFGGRSLVAMALGCAANGFGKVDGFDPWARDACVEGNNPVNDDWWGRQDLEAVMAAAVRGVESSGLGPYATLVRAGSLDPAVAARYDDGSIDVLHQDSNHSESVTTAEVKLWGPKMRLGSFWIFDDVEWTDANGHGTTKAAQKMLLERGFVRVEQHGEEGPQKAGEPATWAIFQLLGATHAR